MKKIFLLNIFALILASFQMSAQCTIQVVTTDITQETCVGSSDASATATAAGSGPINYLWSNGQTTAIATNLTTGTYTVTATDDTGCTGTAEAEITLDPEGVWLMFTFTPVSCNGGSDGTAHVSVMTGVAPYTYIWNDPAGTTNADPVNLVAGQYTVTVTDVNGCSNYGPVTITEPTAIVTITNTTNETCFGDADGTASVNISGGTPGYTYLWSDGQTTSTASNLTAGSYTVTVTDANGCTSPATVSVALTNPQIIISGTSTDVTCFGGSDGSATVSVNSGNGPFSYSWNNGGTSATISNLTAGDYTVTVTGADGCTSVTTVTVAEPPVLTVTTTTTTDILCHGGSDGSITVSSTGGTGTVTYSWSNGGTTSTISNLSAGTYTVTATDGNGCTATTSATITEPTELTATISGIDVTVNGGNDGIATVSVSGGTPGYTYLWSDGQTTATATNLTAGTYTVTITDANGCTTTTTITINEPPSLTITSTPSTCGPNDGTATVTPSGGTPGYTYLWSDGQTTSTATGLAGGTYSVTVTDANGLTSSTSVAVTESSPIIATTSHSNETCVGSSDGHVAVSTSGGVGQMTFLWSNGATTDVVNNLSVGTYTVTVTDQNGCTASSTETIELSPEGIWVDITAIHVTCFNGNDGSATAVVTTGVAPYTYAWSSGGTTPTISNLGAGNYTVSVTDVNGCVGIFTTTINQPTEVIATTSSTNTTCDLANGTAMVSATGGTPGYTYLWSNGQTTQNINGLTAGTYTATATDANGCTAVSSTTITNTNLDIITTSSTTDPSSPTAADGSIDIEVTGGSNYTYLWSNGATTQDISGLMAGCYTVTVTDGAGVCADIETICIGCVLNLDVTTTNNDCINTSIGTATATITSTCSSSTYTYNWTTIGGALVGTTQTISSLLDGTYLVTVTDVNGLTVTGSGEVTGSAGITSSATGTNVLCNGGNTGTATGNGFNGTGNYTYAWSNNETTQTISNLTIGTYTVTVTDQVTTCTSVSEVTIIEPPVIAIAIASSDPTTTGGSDGSIDITVIGGTPGYTYLWSNGATTEDISGLTAGCYTVTVTDANNCTATQMACIGCVLDLVVTTTNNDCINTSIGTATATVTSSCSNATYIYNWTNSTGAFVGNTQTISGLLDGTYLVTVTDGNGATVTGSGEVTGSAGITSSATGTNVLCNGGTTGTATGNGFDGSGNYTYAWSNSETTQMISNIPAGTYTVTVTDAVTTCTSVSEVTITEPPIITITASTSNPTTIGGSDGSIDITVMGGTPGYTYLWSNGATTEDISGLTAGCYTVTVTDSNNCTATQEACIENPPCDLSATTAGTDPSVAGASDGSVDLTVTGGTSPFTYLWSNGETTEDISGLIAGCYTVTVTDANNCTATSEACLTDPPPMLCALTATSTPETCNPSMDGTALASITGCTPPLSFSWENSAGANVGNTAMIMNLTAGMYYVTVTDAIDSVRTDSVEVTFIGGPEANADAVKVTCNSFTDGEVSVTPSGGTTPYSYNWEDVNGSIGNTATISNLPAGTYSVTVTDAVGCTDVDVVEILEDDPIELIDDIVSLDCFGDADASVMVTPSGGVSPYTYQWSTSTTDTDNNISGLTAGVYIVTVTDQNMCTKVDSFMISEPPAVTISADSDTSICENFLVINATASAGATISWFNENMLPLGTGSPFAYLNIPSGTNKIYAVAELNGCPAIDSIEVIQNAVDVSINTTTSVCQGDISQLTATNNLAPDQTITYDWTPASVFTSGTNTATPTLNTSVTGIYEVYLHSENQFGCEQFDTISVAVQDTTNNFIVKQQCIGLEVNYTSGTGTPMIWNFGDGSAQVTAISTTHTYMTADDYTVMMILPPGTNNAACLPDTVSQVVPVADDPIFVTNFTLDYDPCVEDSTTVVFTDVSTNIFGSIDSVWWVWQGDTISTNTQDSMVISQSVMDSMTLFVMTEDGCMDSISQEINLNIIEINLADTIIACIGVDTFLNPFGNPNYQYNWSPAPNGDPNEINPMITATTSMTYAVTITDNSGVSPCSVEKEVFVLVPEAISDLETSPDTILCEAGTVMLSATSSLANEYNWYNEYPPNSPLVLSSPNYMLNLDDMDAPQYYYVEAMDQYGCPTVDSIFAGNAEIIAALNDVENCLNSELTILGGAASNGEMLMYEWLDPNGMVVGMDSTLTFTPSVSGVYTVNVSNEYGCELEENFNINIIDISADVQATADPDTIILGEIVQLDVVGSPDNIEGYKYLWSPTNSLLGTNPAEDKDPEAMPEVNTDYQVVVTDLDNGCTTTTHVFVTVLDICERPYVFFPNVFSPNGDDVNDVLKVESVVVDEVFFVIYNRWGEKVFEGNSVDSAWDGTHNGEAVCTDVYGYYLRARCVNGKVYEEKGNVTVLK